MELNDFFSKAVINLKIILENFDPLSENINHSLKAIVKYRKHSSEWFLNLLIRLLQKVRAQRNQYVR